MDTLTQTEEEQVAERIVRNQLAIKELEEENATLKQYFKSNEAYPAGVTKEVGKFYIKVTANARVDDALARANLGLATYKRLSKTVIDGPMAKKILAPDQYAKIQKVYDNKIEIGLT